MHGDARHHVLETSRAPAERFRQGESMSARSNAISSARARSSGECRRHQAGLATALGQVRRRATTIGRAGLEPLLQPAVHVDVVQCFHHRVQRGELRPRLAIGARHVTAPRSVRSAKLLSIGTAGRYAQTLSMVQQ